MSTTLLKPDASAPDEQIATKYVYSFGPWGAEGDQNMKNSLGGKGANLAEMCRLKLPVPAGFTISTEYCSVYLHGGRQFSESLQEEVTKALAQHRRGDGQEVRRRGKPAPHVLPQRRPQVDAGHDGNRAQRGPLPGHDTRPGGQVRQRAFRLGRLPPLDHDVFRRGDGKGRRHRDGRRPRHPHAA